MTFGDRLRMLRQERGWTQADLAERLHVSRATVAGYESKGREPREELLIAIADVFGITLDRLLGRDGGSSTGVTGVGDVAIATVDSPDTADWKTLAQALAEALKLQAENERLRAENERLRIEKVDAVAQDNLRRLLDRLGALDAPHAPGREGAGAVRGSEARAE